MGSSSTAIRSRIQIVEDELIIAADLEKSLTSMGYEVSSIVDTGIKAVEQASSDHPSLILMDIKLKGKMDGIEAADVIRKKCRLPVVFLSANVDDSLLNRAKLTEPFGYLLKPFDNHELMSTIETALYRHKLELKLSESEQRFRSLVENAADAFYVCDAAGRLVDVNAAACDALGFTRDELLAMRVPDINTELTAERISLLLKEAQNSDDPITLKGFHKKADSSSFPIEVRITSFYSDGKPLLLALARDTSEHERLVSELKEAIRKVNSLKSIVPLCVLKKNLTNANDIGNGIRDHHNSVVNQGVCAECLNAFRNDISSGGKRSSKDKNYSCSKSDLQSSSQPHPSPRALPKDSRPSR
jgi:PAS domain S-box-containing protein